MLKMNSDATPQSKSNRQRTIPRNEKIINPAASTLSITGLKGEITTKPKPKPARNGKTSFRNVPQRARRLRRTLDPSFP
jgi:hypothetical protein